MNAPTLREVASAVRAALDGGPAVTPFGWSGRPLPGAALVVETSGSTGRPKTVHLSADAVRRSASASAERLGGQGHWLAALPPTHIAGLNVVARAVLAGGALVPLEPGPFTAESFLEAVGRLPAGPRYVSLVPTQLGRLLAGGEGAVEALAGFDGVLVGGAGAGATMLASARDAGVSVMETYGMAETCGGCVYDGAPLDGVGVALDAEGRIDLSGPTLALGYDEAEATRRAFEERSGTRWFRTRDRGAWDPGGRLTLVGRLDTTVITGGVNVSPERIEALITGVADVVVVGLPDPEWGQIVTALVVAGDGPAPTLAGLRRLAKDQLDAAHAPRAVGIVGAIPSLTPGKPDRAAATALAAGLRREGRLDLLTDELG
jgi:O-succinylbenzoic acid--CoA ligase